MSIYILQEYYLKMLIFRRYTTCITQMSRIFSYADLALQTILSGIQVDRPVTVAEQSKACTVFARSESGIVGSNTTQGMDV
jgi:hypothetical protein